MYFRVQYIKNSSNLLTYHQLYNVLHLSQLPRHYLDTYRNIHIPLATHTLHPSLDKHFPSKELASVTEQYICKCCLQAQTPSMTKKEYSPMKKFTTKNSDFKWKNATCGSMYMTLSYRPCGNRILIAYVTSPDQVFFSLQEKSWVWGCHHWGSPIIHRWSETISFATAIWGLGISILVELCSVHNKNSE